MSGVLRSLKKKEACDYKEDCCMMHASVRIGIGVQQNGE